MKTTTAPRADDLIVWLNGERYLLVTPEQASELGARMWSEEHIPDQAIPDVGFTVPIMDFSAGAGFTFEGPPGTYEDAEGWDAGAPGKPTTWPQHALGTSFTSTDYKGWLFFAGNYLYAARGRFVIKYAMNEDPGSTWSILERHDLGSGIVCAGRPRVWGGRAYVPRRTGAAGSLAVFHELTTIVATSVETQRIVISGTPTAGTYTVTFDGKTTAALAFNADGAAVQAALRLIAGLEDVTVVTTGTVPNFTHTVTMTGVGGSLTASSPPQMTSTSSLTGGVPVITHSTTGAGTVDTWTAGPSNREFRCFAVWQDKLVGAKGNQVWTCATTPTTEANWAPNSATGNAVGEAGRNITDLAVWNRFLMVGKVDGLWSFDENLATVNELPDLEMSPDDQNCVGMGNWNGHLLVPLKAGLVYWRPGSYMFVGPEQDGMLEGDKSTGWGRVAGIAAFGRYGLTVLNDAYNRRAVMGSLMPGTDRRGPVVPHSHQAEGDAYYEDVTVLASLTQPMPILRPSNVVDQSAVGTVEWELPDNAEGVPDAVYATANPGTSHYLRFVQMGAAIPSDATITGVTFEILRNAFGASVLEAEVAMAAVATITATATVN